MARKTKFHDGINIDKIKARIQETVLEKSATMRERLDAFEKKGFPWRKAHANPE